MATSVIMPALEMAQETGLLVRWLKRDGESVTKGEPLMEIETDKVTLEIEAAASGVLGGILAKEGDAVPVGRTIAWILAPGETPPAIPAANEQPSARATTLIKDAIPQQPVKPAATISLEVSPLARKIAAEHGIDLSRIRPSGKRIEKADVLAHIQGLSPAVISNIPSTAVSSGYRLFPASPKARRLAAERGLELPAISGSGPDGAVQAADVLAFRETAIPAGELETPDTVSRASLGTLLPENIGTVWRIMAERTTASWTSVPHFYLVREVVATSLVQWRQQVASEVEKQAGVKLTYTDLLVKVLGFALPRHPRLIASWKQGTIHWNEDVNIGLAVAVEDGLVAPVIPAANRLTISEITARRWDLVERAQTRKLRPVDIEGGTFTLSNLGMYKVDAFNAIINSPQAAILAVGQIANRVVAVDSQPVVRPTIILSLSCDHRVVDGARGAQFLDDLSNLIENPWRLLI